MARKKPKPVTGNDPNRKLTEDEIRELAELARQESEKEQHQRAALGDRLAAIRLGQVPLPDITVDELAWALAHISAYASPLTV